MVNFNIKLYEPIIGSQEKKLVKECLDSSWISSKGKYIQKFEESFSKFIKIKHTISVVNGTAALHLSLLALGIKEKDEVIIPTFTYIAPVNTIKYVGAKVKFIDSKLDNWQLDENKLKKMISKKTKAVIVPHLYGQVAEIKKIQEICKRKKIFLIEDCAEAFGCYYGKKHVGTFGDIATFSFFGSKMITTGEGGAVVTNNKKIAKKVYRLKTVGVTKDRNYWHDILGYNYRMTNICAAIGLAQLKRANQIIKYKKRVFQLYYKHLKNSKLKMNELFKNIGTSFWLIVIFVKNKSIRDRLAKFLKRNKVETRTAFYPIHTMPMYYSKKNKKAFPNAEILSKTGLCLPSGPSLKDIDIKKICKLINNFLYKN